MFFIKYLSILVILTVQYSLQRYILSPSSDENLLDSSSLQGTDLSSDLLSGNSGRLINSNFGREKRGLKEKKQQVKDFLKSALGRKNKSNSNKNPGTIEQKLDEAVKRFEEESDEEKVMKFLSELKHELNEDKEIAKRLEEYMEMFKKTN